jgi:hypothetical protein
VTLEANPGPPNRSTNVYSPSKRRSTVLNIPWWPMSSPNLGRLLYRKGSYARARIQSARAIATNEKAYGTAARPSPTSPPTWPRHSTNWAAKLRQRTTAKSPREFAPVPRQNSRRNARTNREIHRYERIRNSADGAALFASPFIPCQGLRSAPASLSSTSSVSRPLLKAEPRTASSTCFSCRGLSPQQHFFSAPCAFLRRPPTVNSAPP